MTSNLVVVDAVIDDADALMELINDAYQVETGFDGVAFKLDGITRLIHVSELYDDIKSGRILKTIDHSNRNEEIIVGAMVWNIESNKLTFGPFAVSRRRRGEGIGKLLIDKVYTIARAHGINLIQIQVYRS
jgi:GNAT superfamily N-acetyltransferase